MSNSLEENYNVSISPKVSVIVPVYNVEKYLEKCLESLINQTLNEIEIIVVNDGSTDNSLNIIEKYAQKDYRIKIINQKNQGLSGARNSGFKLARGEYISFIDSDDWVDNDFLEKLYNSAISNNVSIAISTIIRKREKTQKYRVHYTEEKIYETLEDKINICNIPTCCYVWNKLYKKSLLENSEFTVGRFYEDVLWTPEIIKKADKIITVPNTNYYYRVNNSSIVKKCQSPKKQEDSYFAKKCLKKFFEDNNLNLTKKQKTITKKIKYFFNIPILKIKEFENWETFYLLGFLPLFKIANSDNRICYNILGIRFLKRKNKISKKELIKLNLKYENEEQELVYPKVKTKEETLSELVKSEKSIARYGDGEFNLIWGESLPFQDFSEKLQKRLQEILVSNNENLLVCIPHIFKSLKVYNSEAAYFWRRLVVTNRSKIYNILNLDKQYFDTETTRPYMDLADKSKVEEYFKDFKKVWNDKDVVFVEGKMSRLGVGNNLFDNCKSIKRIICPARNAFESYDTILETCKKFPKDTLFVIALGPTATVLAYDLFKLGYRALDLGHIDIEYEWFLLKATKKVAIKNKYVNEVKKGRINSDLNNEKYLSEIIETIE